MVANVVVVLVFVQRRRGSLPGPLSASASHAAVGHHATAVIARTVGPEAMGQAPVAIALGDMWDGQSEGYVSLAGEAGEGVVHAG